MDKNNRNIHVVNLYELINSHLEKKYSKYFIYSTLGLISSLTVEYPERESNEQGKCDPVPEAN